jgi:hypothetical protein
MTPYENITERISLSPRLHRRLTSAVEQTIDKFMRKNSEITIADIVTEFVLRHPGLVNAALYQFLEHWFEEVNWRGTDPEKALEAMKMLTKIVKPYAKANPEITVGQACALEERRILDKMERELGGE